MDGRVMPVVFWVVGLPANNVGGFQNPCYNLPLPERGEAGEMDEWLKSHAWKACIGS
jgi:hypothetical protein